MTPQARDLAALLSGSVAIGRFPGHPFTTTGAFDVQGMYGTAPLQSAEEVAEHLLSRTDFRGLGLGGWQGVVADDMITEALLLLVPAWMQPEFDLLFNGVKIAAERQRGESWRQIGIRLFWGSIGGAIITAIVRSA
jgi:hypothetical protein